MRQKIISILMVIAILMTTVDITVFASEATVSGGDLQSWEKEEDKSVRDSLTGNEVECNLESIENVSGNDIKEGIEDIGKTVSEYEVAGTVSDNAMINKSVLETITGQCGENLTWTLDGEVLRISGTGDMWDYGYDNKGGEEAPWRIYEEQFTQLILEEGITSIGDNAFRACFGLKGELVIPDTVNSIGDSAFACCYYFDKLILSKNLKIIGNNAFGVCFGLKGELIIPEGVERIGWGAFEICTGLSGNLIIPSSVKVIDMTAFSGCENIGDTIYIKSKDIILSDLVFSGTGITTVYGTKGTDAEAYATRHGLKFVEYDAVSKGEKVFFNGHTYQMFYTSNLTWKQMQEYCKDNNGYLASIASEEENQFLYNYMLSCGMDVAYIGLSEKEEGQWQWANGEYTDYINWADGEPNNLGGNENYVCFMKKHNGKWNDGHGTESAGYICEWDEMEEVQASYSIDLSAFENVCLNKDIDVEITFENALDVNETNESNGIIKLWRKVNDEWAVYKELYSGDKYDFGMDGYFYVLEEEPDVLKIKIINNFDDIRDFGMEAIPYGANLAISVDSDTLFFKNANVIFEGIDINETSVETGEWGLTLDNDFLKFENSNYDSNKYSGFDEKYYRLNDKVAYLLLAGENSGVKKIQEYINPRIESWEGSCMGMVSVMALAKMEKLNLQAWDGKAKNCYEMEWPKNSKEKFGTNDLINYYQLLQYLKDYPIYESYTNVIPQVLDGEILWENMVDEIISKAKKISETKKPLILTMGIKFKGDDGKEKRGKHACLAYAYMEEDNKYKIILYDPTYPASDTILEIDKKNYEVGLKGSWKPLKGEDACKLYFLGYVDTDGLINYSIDEYAGAFQNTKSIFLNEESNEHAELYFDINTNFMITNADGKYLTYQDGIIDGTMNVYKLRSVGIGSGEGAEYRIEVDKSEEFIYSSIESSTEFTVYQDGSYMDTYIDCVGAITTIVPGKSVHIIGNDVKNYRVLVDVNQNALDMVGIEGSSTENVLIECADNEQIVLTAGNEKNTIVTLYSGVEVESMKGDDLEQDVVIISSTEDGADKEDSSSTEDDLDKEDNVIIPPQEDVTDKEDNVIIPHQEDVTDKEDSLSNKDSLEQKQNDSIKEGGRGDDSIKENTNNNIVFEGNTFNMNKELMNKEVERNINKEKIEELQQNNEDSKKNDFLIKKESDIDEKRTINEEITSLEVDEKIDSDSLVNQKSSGKIYNNKCKNGIVYGISLVVIIICFVWWIRKRK